MRLQHDRTFAGGEVYATGGIDRMRHHPVRARNAGMWPPRWSTLTAARDHCDPSQMPAKSASSLSNIAAIVPHLSDSMPTMTTTASSVVWMISV